MKQHSHTHTPSLRMKSDALKAHRNSERHTKAISQELLQRMSSFHKEMAERKEVSRDVLEKAFAVAYFLSKEHIANRKFLRLIKFAEETLEVSRLKYFNHRSEGSIREIFLVLGQSMKQEILDKVRQVPSYGLMVDEATDISVMSQMITFIQYVSPDTSGVETAFLSVQNVFEEFESANSDALSTLIQNEVHQCNLPIDNMKGLATDGASVMIGKHNGVAAKLKEVNPVLLNVHCICHKLALACTDTNTEIQYIKKVEETLRQLWKYFEHSPKRLAVYLKAQINLKKCQLQLNEQSENILIRRLKKACSTRWLSFDKAVSAAHQEYEALLYTLHMLDEAGCATAHGLLGRMRDVKFLGTIYILRDVLPILSKLSKAFQAGSVNFSQIIPLVNSTKASLQELLDTNSNTPMKKFALDLESYTSISEDLKMSRLQADSLHNLQDQYIRALNENIERRFAESSPVLASFKVFDPLAIPNVGEMGFSSYGNCEFRSLAEHFYQCDDEDVKQVRTAKLLAEWHQMKFNVNENIKPVIPTDIKTGSSCTTSTQWFLCHLMKLKSTYRPFFSELLLLAEVALCLPVSNAWPERGASAVKLIKSRCRSHLKNDMLNSMLHIKINGPALGDVAVKALMEKAVQVWLDAKQRKKLPKNFPNTAATEGNSQHSTEHVSLAEVVDIAVQTDEQEALSHQIQEVSTLLNLPVVPVSCTDSDDSAFESDDEDDY